MILYLLRHTKTKVAEGICYGQSDVDIIPADQKLVNQIYNRVLRINPQVIFTSPLKRCGILADMINVNGVKIVSDHRLKELNFGKWEGHSWDDIEKTNIAQNWFGDFLYMKCPGGESYHELLLRVKHFLNHLKKQYYKNENILIVTHAGVIRAMYAITNKIKPERAFGLKVDFGEIVALNYN